MLKLWGRRNSGNVQKVLWLLGELGLPYEHIPVGGAFGGLDTQAFLALNPHGRIPVIEDDGIAVWESHAILRYLAASYSEGHLWQVSCAARASIDGWMDWGQTTLQPDFLGIFWGFFRTPEPQRDGPAIQKSISLCSKHFLLLNSILEKNNFLTGKAFSLADIAVGSLLYRYFELEIERPVIPHVAEWYARLKERPAYREHVMLPFDDLRGTL